MIRILSFVVLVCTSSLFATDTPKMIVKPEAFRTLVNPNCSHCVDEAIRRQTELQENDPVLLWTRGKYDGGAIPFRFFLNPYRVISDTYGVFVYDPDAGYARGFKASLDFQFHGWYNGVMVMKHKDGTIFSCLSGQAIDGPRKGEKLTPWPTVVSQWGWYMKANPNGVAYHMYEKYKPVELPTKVNDDSVASRGKYDRPIPAEEVLLGLIPGKEEIQPKAYRIKGLQNDVFATINDSLSDGSKVVVLWFKPTNTAAAYFPVVELRKKTNQLSEEGELQETAEVKIQTDGKSITAPYVDQTTQSRFDVTGRCVEGKYKGWTLKAYDSVQVKAFAWFAEFPTSLVYEKAQPKVKPVDPKKTNEAIKQISGTSEFLRLIPKKFGIIKQLDLEKQQITLLLDKETEAKSWQLTNDAEIKVHGWWGRLSQFKPEQRVWVWFKTDRQKKPINIFMLADEASEKDIHSKPDANLETLRNEQKQWLRSQWIDQGLPGSIAFTHFTSGELDLMLDHEAMRWGRSLRPGDSVQIQSKPDIQAVVKNVSAWRERTQLRLVINGLELAELNPGQRVQLKMKTPSKEVEDDIYPPDIDLVRSNEERIEWFLANIYCVCGVGNDICTGHFYTLASCNPNGCGAPNATRKQIATWIDKGHTNRQIFDDLRKERGEAMLKPHLKP